MLKDYDFYQPILFLHYIREYLFVSSSKRVVIFDLKENKPIRYILEPDCYQPNLFAVNNNSDQLHYCFM